MGQPISDAVFELHGACVHSVRFSLSGPLDYPYARAPVSDSYLPTALFRRMMAASPPPRRQGAPWHTGMTLAGNAFDPSGPVDRLADVRHEDGIAHLDSPQPGTVVLDWWFDVPRVRREVTFPGDDDGRFVLSIPYWDPADESGGTFAEEVPYSVTHRVRWRTRPEARWVAVSFDAFWPPERDSADLLIPLGSCDEHCPS